MFPRLLISTLFPYTTLFRSCVAHATSGNDTITFGVTGTIELGVTAFPPLNTSVAIQGPGASRLTVNGGGTSHCIIAVGSAARSEEHTSELQSLRHLVCRLLL